MRAAVRTALEKRPASRKHVLSYSKQEDTIHGFFYKKLGSAPSTKSFLISHENFAILVLKFCDFST